MDSTTAPGPQPEAPAHGGTDAVVVTVSDLTSPAAAAPGQHAPAVPPAPLAGAALGGVAKSPTPPPSAPPLAGAGLGGVGKWLASPAVGVPFKWPRVGLLVAALVFALATIIAQGVMMRHSISVVRGFYYLYTDTYKGTDFAKAPGLVIATGVLALVLGVTLLALLFFPIARCLGDAPAHRAASAQLWTSVVEVALVGVLLVFWVASLGVAAKTMDIFSGEEEDKTWQGGAAAAVAMVTISLLLWAAILVLSVLTLLAAVRAWKSHRQAPGAFGPGAPQHPAVYAVPQSQHSAVYAAPQQPAVAYDAPQQPGTAYAAPQQPATAYDAPQQPALAYDAPQQPAATYAAPQQPAVAYAAPQHVAQYPPAHVSHPAASDVQAV